MTTLVSRAFLLASELHSEQRRKAALVSGVPYLSHLLEVAGMIMASGAPEIVVAAALLHDAIEDQGNRTRVFIQEQLGTDVLALVEECTEPGTGGSVKAPWLERKNAALLRTRDLSLFALMIMVADKLQNVREIQRNVVIRGNDAFTGFRAGKSSVLWYQEQIGGALGARLDVLKMTHQADALLLMTACWLREFHAIVGFLKCEE